MIIYGVIYCLTSPSGKVYIGQTIDYERRMKAYSSGNCKGQLALYSAIIKYGWDNFSKSILAIGYSRTELDMLEFDFIRSYKSTLPSKGYNLKDGGSNGKPTEDTRKKMSITRTGKSMPIGTGAKISASKKGKPMSLEQKAILSERAKGRVMSKETREKMKQSAIIAWKQPRLTKEA